MKCWSLSRVRLFVTPWTVAHQALSMGFSRQEYWSGLSFPFSGDPSDPGIESGSPALQADSSPSEPRGKSFTRKNSSKRKWRHGGKGGGCTRQILGGGYSQAYLRKSCLSGEKPVTESHDWEETEGLPRWCNGKESAYRCRRHSLNPGLGSVTNRETVFT